MSAQRPNQSLEPTRVGEPPLAAQLLQGFPRYRKCARWFFSSLFFPDPIAVPLRLLSAKVKDCETTIGHVGRTARTLMKDARRGLIR